MQRFCKRERSFLDSEKSISFWPGGGLQVKPWRSLANIPAHPRLPVLKEMKRRFGSFNSTAWTVLAFRCRSGLKFSGSSQILGFRPSPRRLRRTWLPLGIKYPATLVGFLNSSILSNHSINFFTALLKIPGCLIIAYPIAFHGLSTPASINSCKLWKDHNLMIDQVICWLGNDHHAM